MEKLMRVVRSEYFPAGVVLGGVLLFWTVGLLGGLSWLSGGQSPLTVLSWMIFIYAAVVLSPVAVALSVMDISRRYRGTHDAGIAEPLLKNAAPLLKNLAELRRMALARLQRED
ncbi:hypothetical protein [Arthrobacter sp. R-11]|uniref:hypothetical protein n=1 Tax=Arthrobacter sp. R-11 TaxID=3404053 RepID=UPI003CFB61CB